MMLLQQQATSGAPSIYTPRIQLIHEEVLPPCKGGIGEDDAHCEARVRRWWEIRWATVHTYTHIYIHTHTQPWQTERRTPLNVRNDDDDDDGWMDGWMVGWLVQDRVGVSSVGRLARWCTFFGGGLLSLIHI